MGGPQRIAQTQKGPIEYRLEGQGTPVVVLNGGHCSRETRLSHERLVQCGFLVVTMSRPGYDDTPSVVGRSAQEAADGLAALLNTLGIAMADVIGISAAGPTALAFAQQHPGRIRRLVLESAVTLPWGAGMKAGSRLMFGPTERVTWAAMRAYARLMPGAAVRTLMLGLTTLDVRTVVDRLSPDDVAYVIRMIEASHSGRGFMNDIEHEVSGLDCINCPTLVMYSPHDKSVRPENSTRLSGDIPGCQIYATDADSHLLWIGKSAAAVWDRRLAFLTT